MIQGSNVVRGRYAPSPTGDLHLGNAAAALLSWLSARSQNGTYVLRIEDLDPPRAVAGAPERIIEDLTWLGLDWDEGPDIGGSYGPYAQSERSSHYEHALEDLARIGRLFPSSISRKELEEFNSDGSRVFARELRPKYLDKNWFSAYQTEPPEDTALRFAIDQEVTSFIDGNYGEQRCHPPDDFGDFVVMRKDGLYAYQLAVGIDDCLMEMSEVVRGADLLDSTFQQLLVIEALGLRPPAYLHVPILVDEDGRKLGKTEKSLSLRSLRDAGVIPERVVGFIAYKYNLIPKPEPVPAAKLVSGFDIRKIGTADIVVQNDEFTQAYDH